MFCVRFHRFRCIWEFMSNGRLWLVIMGLKWTARNASLIIDRLTSAKDSGAVFNWIIEVKKKCPGLVHFLDFMAASGSRYEESINSYNLIVELSMKGTLEKDYFSSESGALEHCKHKDIFLRRTKKAFVGFVPNELIEKIKKDGKTLELHYVQTKAKRALGYKRFGDIREAYATPMTSYLKESEINFLQGRVTGVFMQHYFNPASVLDLRERVLKGVKEILSKSFNT